MKIIARYPGLPFVDKIIHIGTSGHVSKKYVLILTVFICIVVLVIFIQLNIINLNKKQNERQSTIYKLEQSTELHYGIVIDMGSSGSRVYIYYWPDHDGKVNHLLDIQQLTDEYNKPVVKKVEPGISSFAKTPQFSFEYLKPLLQFAAVYVPQVKHRETPLYIMATAGLRMLSRSEQDGIMNNVKQHVNVYHDFLFDESHIEVITGKQEGTYQWIAINYHLKNFENGNNDESIEDFTLPDAVLDIPLPNRIEKKKTVGIIDMGGGSVQIAFEIPKSISVPMSLSTEFDLGCSDTDHFHHYRIYVSTFLGYGGNIARERFKEYLIQNSNVSLSHDSLGSSNSSLERHSHIIRDPCLPLDFKESVEYDNIPYQFHGTGDFTLCRQKVKPLLNKTSNCIHSSCSINGTSQPFIDTFTSNFYGFSEYYYTTEDVLHMSGNYDYQLFSEAAKKYCGTRWNVLKGWYNQNLYPNADQNRFKLQCFKSAWISTVLHEGFNFPTNYNHLTTAMLLNNREISWTLGALLYKVRFYPLRSMQYHTVSQNTFHSKANHQFQYSTGVFVFCLFIVLSAILFQLRRLKIVKHTGLHKVPSVVSFLIDPGQMEDGITIRNFNPIIIY